MAWSFAGDTPCSPQSYVLYVTAYPQYAMECCRTHPFDFILKPYSDGRLYQAIADLAQVIGARKPSATLGGHCWLAGAPARHSVRSSTLRQTGNTSPPTCAMTASPGGKAWSACWGASMRTGLCASTRATPSTALPWTASTSPGGWSACITANACLHPGASSPACETRGTATRPALGKRGWQMNDGLLLFLWGLSLFAGMLMVGAGESAIAATMTGKRFRPRLFFINCAFFIVVVGSKMWLAAGMGAEGYAVFPWRSLCCTMAAPCALGSMCAGSPSSGGHFCTLALWC